MFITDSLLCSLTQDHKFGAPSEDQTILQSAIPIICYYPNVKHPKTYFLKILRGK